MAQGPTSRRKPFVSMREYGEPDRRVAISWRHEVEYSLVPTRQVAMLRFYREDGLDPRVDPEPDGTHLHRGPLGSGIPEASCGQRGGGFSDYGPIDGVTCPTCAAMLAGQLLNDRAD